MKLYIPKRSQLPLKHTTARLIKGAALVIAPIAAGMFFNTSSALASFTIEVGPTPDGRGLHVQETENGRIRSGRIIRPDVLQRGYRSRFDVTDGTPGGYFPPSGTGMQIEDYKVERYEFPPEFYPYRPKGYGAWRMDCRRAEQGYYCCPDGTHYGHDGMCHDRDVKYQKRYTP